MIIWSLIKGTGIILWRFIESLLKAISTILSIFLMVFIIIFVLAPVVLIIFVLDAAGDEVNANKISALGLKIFDFISKLQLE